MTQHDRSVSWTDTFDFVDPFVRVTDPDTASRLIDELRREVGEGHPAHGSGWSLVARALDQDDVLVHDGTRVALVHLTWSRRQEPLPWPRTTFVESPGDFVSLLASR